MSKVKPQQLNRQITRVSRRWYFYIPLTATVLLIWVGQAVAQEAATSNNFDPAANIWMLIAAALVFFMNAGFAMLEAGLCRSENAINVLAKNLIVFCVTTLAFWLFGFGLMFSDSGLDMSLVGKPILLLDKFSFPTQIDIDGNTLTFPSGFVGLESAWPGLPFTTLFLFQLVFAGTAATIVSGAVAERIKFWAFLLFSFFLVAFFYPLTGHWIWGPNGWLGGAFNFKDFAGSTVVHSVGGMAGLIGALLLKPRNGRFGYDAELDKFESNEDTKPFKADNLGFATLGCLILWLGWFGFNGGSVGNIEYAPHVITTTMISAATGGVAAIFFCPALTGKPSLGSIINGILGGLVGITASAAYVDVGSSLIIGGISGLVVLVGEKVLEAGKIDDPVGAVPVHLFCGIWGTIAVGIFSRTDSLEYGAEAENYNAFFQTVGQLIGNLTVCITIAILSFIAWVLIGLSLYWWDRLNRGKRLTLARKHQRNQGFVDLLINDFFKNVRKGIRVSVAEEESGSDGFFENPS